MLGVETEVILINPPAFGPTEGGGMNGAPNPGPYLRPNLIDQIDKFEIYSRCILSQMNPEKE